MRDDSDESLMLKYQKGDARAFAVLVERHRRPIYFFVLRYVRNPVGAEDITQDTFLRVVRSGDTWKPQAKFTTWLFTIARNLCVDASRRAKSTPSSLDVPINPDEEDGPSKLDFLPSSATPADEGKISARLKARMSRAISRLPDEQREILLLREVADLHFTEIAEIIGTNENTVKSRLRYALQKLRESLADYRDQAAEEVAK